MKRQKIISYLGIVLLLCIGLSARAQTPTPITVNGPTLVCEGQKYLYDYLPSPGLVYSWSINSNGYISTITGNQASVYWGAKGLGILTVYGVDTNGDTTELGVTNVTILGKPEPIITTDNRVACQPLVPPPPNDDPFMPPNAPVFTDTGCIKVCENSTVTYTANGNPTSTYTWTVNGGTITGGGGNTCVVTWGASGPGSVSVKETTTNGCEGTKTICIDIIESPIADFFAFPDSNSTSINICDSSEVVFIDRSTASPGSPIVAWHWDFGDGTYSNAQGGRLMPMSHVYRGPGFYTAVLTVTNACGCKSSFSIDINVDGQKALKIDCPAVVCEGDIVDYSVNTTCTGTNWSVIGGTIIFQTGSTVQVQWNNVDASGFGYVFYDAQGCPGVCPAIFVAKVPVVLNSGTINGPDTICPDKQYIYRLPQWPSTNFTWHETTGNANVIASDQPNEVVISVDAANAGNTITIECNYNNTLLGCSGFATKDVYVQERPVLDGPDIVCLNTNGTYTLTGAGAASASWTLTYPNLSTATGSGASFAPLFDQVGPYILTVDGDFCPPPIKEITVNTPPPPPDTIIGPDTICKGAPVKFEAGDDIAGTIFNWWVDNGDANAASGNNSYIKLDMNSTGPFVIHLWRESTMSPHCHSDTITKVIDTPVVNFTISGPDTVCPSSYHKYSVNYLDGETYEWKIYNEKMGSVDSFQATPNIQVLWNNAPGTAQLVCRIRKCFSNYYYDTLEVYIRPTPTVTITGPSSVCSEVDFSLSVNGSGSSVIWDMGDGNGPFNVGHVINYRYKISSGPAATRKVTATVLNPYGCPGEAIAKKTLTVNPGPSGIIVSTGSTIYYCDSNMGQTLSVLQLVPSPTITGYEWYKNGVLDGTSSTYYANAFGTYYVKLTGSNGCVYTSAPYDIIYECQDTCNLNFTPTVSIDSWTLDSCGYIHVTSSHSATGFLSYHWTATGGTITYSDEDEAYIKYDTAGTYTVSYNTSFTDNTDTCDFSAKKSIKVPYMARIGVTQLCTGSGGSGTRDVLLSFTGSQTSPITNYTFKVNGTTVYSGSNSSYVDTLNYGSSYLFEIIIGDGTNPTCWAMKTVLIDTLIEARFDFWRDTTCAVQAAVDFTNTTIPTTGYLSHWDFGDVSENVQRSPERVYNAQDNYQVVLTVTDAHGCTDDTMRIVPVIDMRLVGSILPTPPSPCKGQPVFLTYTPTGATFMPEWYDWMNDDINFASGIFNPMTVFESGYYWVIGSDHYGCYWETEADTVNIVEIPPAFVSGDTIQCQDASFILSGYAGSDPDIQYSWMLNGAVIPGANSALLRQLHSTPGTYTYRVIITIPNPAGGNCSDTSDPFVVTVRSLPAPPGISYSIVDCNDYTVELQASPALPYGTYNWSTGDAGSPVYVRTGGNFQLTYTDTFGCESDSAIAVPKDPRVYLWIFPTGCYTICPPQTLLVTGPIIPFLQWDYLRNGGGYMGGTGIPWDVTIFFDGVYNLRLDNGWCTVTSDNMYVTTYCGGEGKPGMPADVLTVEGQDVAMTLIPNPASDQVTVDYNFKGNSTTRTIEVYDVTGKLVNSHEAIAATGKWTLNLDKLTPGIYNVMMREDGNVLLYSKLSIVK